MVTELPASDKINIKKLGRLFDNMSESYKLFWFQAIVDSVFEGKDVFSYNDLIDRMIASGWYMVSEYKLNLGPNDTMEKMILLAYERFGIKSSESRSKIVEALNKKTDPELLKMKRRLGDCVPYRLQAPYLDDIKGKTWNRRKSELAGLINEHHGLIYRFEEIDGLNSIITISNNFKDYVQDNYDIISGWIMYKMIEYLQKRNPSVPGIIYKIDPPQERELAGVIKYWKQILEQTQIRDIYSDTILNGNPISIDHFVPWSYVAHDELWNLTPTTKSINSSKSNNLPDWDKYIDKFCELQYIAFEASHSNDLTKKLFNDCLDKYVNDMNIKRSLYKSDQGKTEFVNHLKDIIEPVYNAAKNLGFSEWRAINE